MGFAMQLEGWDRRRWRSEVRSVLAPILAHPLTRVSPFFAATGYGLRASGYGLQATDFGLRTSDYGNGLVAPVARSLQPVVRSTVRASGANTSRRRLGAHEHC